MNENHRINIKTNECQQIPGRRLRNEHEGIYKEVDLKE